MKISRLSFRNKLLLSLPILAVIAFLIIAFLPSKTSATDEIDELNSLIDKFQEAYSGKDGVTLRTLFFSNAVIAYDFDDGETQRVHSVSDWISGTEESTFADNEFLSDTLTNRQIEVYRNIAYAVCDYRYVSDTEIGVGNDIFTFLKMRGTWKIISLQYTGDEEPR